MIPPETLTVRNSPVMETLLLEARATTISRPHSVAFLTDSKAENILRSSNLQILQSVIVYDREAFHTVMRENTVR